MPILHPGIRHVFKKQAFHTPLVSFSTGAQGATIRARATQSAAIYCTRRFQRCESQIKLALKIYFYVNNSFGRKRIGARVCRPYLKAILPGTTELIVIGQRRGNLRVENISQFILPLQSLFRCTNCTHQERRDEVQAFPRGRVEHQQGQVASPHLPPNNKKGSMRARKPKKHYRRCIPRNIHEVCVLVRENLPRSFWVLRLF